MIHKWPGRMEWVNLIQRYELILGMPRRFCQCKLTGRNHIDVTSRVSMIIGCLHPYRGVGEGGEAVVSGWMYRLVYWLFQISEHIYVRTQSLSHYMCLPDCKIQNRKQTLFFKNKCRYDIDETSQLLFLYADSGSGSLASYLGKKDFIKVSIGHQINLFND